MSAEWTSDELDRLGRATELQLDAVEERLGQELAAGRLCIIPDARQVPQELYRLLGSGSVVSGSPSCFLFSVQDPHGRFQGRRVAVPPVAGHRRLAVPLYPGQGYQIRRGGIRR